jgi:hypothetical protein
VIAFFLLLPQGSLLQAEELVAPKTIAKLYSIPWVVYSPGNDLFNEVRSIAFSGDEKVILIGTTEGTLFQVSLKGVPAEPEFVCTVDGGRPVDNIVGVPGTSQCIVSVDSFNYGSDSTRVWLIDIQEQSKSRQLLAMELFASSLALNEKGEVFVGGYKLDWRKDEKSRWNDAKGALWKISTPSMQVFEEHVFPKPVLGLSASGKDILVQLELVPFRYDNPSAGVEGLYCRAEDGASWVSISNEKIVDGRVKDFSLIPGKGLAAAVVDPLK